MSERKVVEPAPAKINLYLHVTGKRDDGYHLIESLAAFVGVCDVVRIAEADDLSLNMDGPYARVLETDLAGRDDDNLVFKAARRLAQHAGRPPHVRIGLSKLLPVAAGIGGGSSDAAAVLRALRRLWALDLDDDALAALGLDLGADVPVCVHVKTAWMAGIGEQVTPVQPGGMPIAVVLINPGVALSTPAVFDARTGDFGPPDRLPAIGPDFMADLAARRNDLEPAARRLAPAVGTVIDTLAAASGCAVARMSGSGPTCFGLFPDNADAVAAGAQIAKAHPDWWVTKSALIHGLDAVSPAPRSAG